MEINFALGKNGDHKPSGLGGRLLITVVIRQAGRQADRQAVRQNSYSL